MHKHESLIRRYFAACNAADYAGLTSCFMPDAVHYFPPGLPEIPWRSADVIAKKWIWCVEHLGSQWTIEKVLVSGDSNEAVIEWTHWKRKTGTAQRGDEWYVFDTGAASSRKSAPTTQRPLSRMFLSENSSSSTTRVGVITSPPNEIT